MSGSFQMEPTYRRIENANVDDFVISDDRKSSGVVNLNGKLKRNKIAEYA